MCASRALSRACPPLDVADATGPPAPGPKPPLPRPPAAPSPASAPSAARRLPLAGATPPSARGRASHGRGVAVAPSVGAQSVATACRPTREPQPGTARTPAASAQLAPGRLRRGPRASAKPRDEHVRPLRRAVVHLPAGLGGEGPRSARRQLADDAVLL